MTDSYGACFDLTGSCASTMAANISPQPISSSDVSFWDRIRNPAITEVTDSRLMIMEARVG